MATATVITTFVEHDCACMAVVVVEPNGEHVEYIGRVPLEELTGTAAEKKAKLVAAAKAVRDAQQVRPPSAPTITGSVTV